MAYNTRLRFLTTPGGGGRRILLPHLHTADIAIKPECWSTQLPFTAAKIGGRDPRWVVGFGFLEEKGACHHYIACWSRSFIASYRLFKDLAILGDFLGWVQSPK